MRLSSGHEVYGKNGVFIIAERPSGDVVSAFYAVEGSPGWWRGHAFGRVRRLFLPGAEPLTVAERFMRRP
ncbi:hypothetical protein [Spirillospora sp. CA-128828]|uniref:hypothetical protein n=1 Tax=Spirillospora sp. CA-128828 TaxID=3240033 RepID=UPI003D915D70